jgi:Uma2 family endonuclease
MSVAEATRTMTTEEMLALPDNGTERWLIDGQLRERPMTVRNRWHSRIMARVTYLLEAWRERQPEPRGSVLCGEAGCRLRRDPDVTVGIDVVYVPPDVATRESDDKIDVYRRAGVPLVWVIDPHDRTVLVYREGAEPELVNVRQELSGEPQLSGFRVPVGQLFS